MQTSTKKTSSMNRSKHKCRNSSSKCSFVAKDSAWMDLLTLATVMVHAALAKCGDQVSLRSLLYIMLFLKCITFDGITYPYTNSSHLCTAAKHAGKIPASGGSFTFKITHGRPSYEASTKNGVTSASHNMYNTSIKI